jgi:hypothetical protein
VTVTEASARIKFKLITKNKMFGEVRCVVARRRRRAPCGLGGAH